MIKKEIIKYNEFWYIYQYNYILKKEEEDILLMFPILRDKFLTYEDYMDSQKEYKKIMTYNENNKEDKDLFSFWKKR